MSERRVNCPYCIKYGKTEDTGGHLYVNIEKGVFHCKRCNHSDKLGTGRFMTALGDQILRSLPWYKPSKTKFDCVELFSFKFNKTITLKKSGVVNGNNIRDVYKYACDRLPESVVTEKCMWSPDLPERLFFPLFDDDGKMVVWQARSINNSKPKYLSWGNVSEYVYTPFSYGTEHIHFIPGENKNDFTYGGRVIVEKKWAVILEGPINALSCPHGIALFGKSLSCIQFLTITHSYDIVYIALDHGAEKEIQEIAEKLKPYVEVKIITFEDERDANDLGWEVMLQKIQNAKTYEEYLEEIE